MKVLALLASLVLTLLLASVATANNPPGQNDSCHGANLASCRPDPQPSHGKDCTHQPPGNPNGNDDHCAKPPTPFPSVSTPSPVATPIGSPNATPRVPNPTPSNPISVATPSPSIPTSTPISTPELTAPPTNTLPTTTTNEPSMLAIGIVIGLIIGTTVFGNLIRYRKK